MGRTGAPAGARTLWCIVHEGDFPPNGDEPIDAPVHASAAFLAPLHRQAMGIPVGGLEYSWAQFLYGTLEPTICGGPYTHTRACLAGARMWSDLFV